MSSFRSAVFLIFCFHMTSCQYASTYTEQSCPGMTSVLDFAEYSTKTLNAMTRDYYNGASMLEQTLRDNRDAFARYRLRPRLLRDVANRDLSTTILGNRISMPIAISPSAMQMLAHPQGENGTSKAAKDAGSLMILSTLSTISLEEVAAAAPRAPRWFQLYIYKDRELTRQLVQRAEKAGYTALVLTVDGHVLGIRLAEKRNKFVLPKNLTLANLKEYNDKNGFDSEGGSGLAEYFSKQLDPSVTWKDIQWLKSITSLPIVTKGILTGEDAKLAIQNGASAILVSNHGGRQLDGVPASLDALEEVVQAVGGTREVYMDGGVRTGTDVLKALAIGAKAVFIGRPNVWGLSYKGQVGSRCVLEMLREELDNAMGLAGFANIGDIERDLVVKQSFYTEYRK